jgi:hypothetical protein
MTKNVELEVKPENGGTIVTIPLSSVSADNKAQAWAVRKADGSDLIKADSVTGVTTIGGAAVKLPYYASNSARDAAISTPVNGMMVVNEQVSAVQVYVGGEWLSMAVA